MREAHDAASEKPRRRTPALLPGPLVSGPPPDHSSPALRSGPACPWLVPGRNSLPLLGKSARRADELPSHCEGRNRTKPHGEGPVQEAAPLVQKGRRGQDVAIPAAEQSAVLENIPR